MLNGNDSYAEFYFFRLPYLNFRTNDLTLYDNVNPYY